MGSKEEVVVVAQDGHGHVPGQVEEGLQEGREQTYSQQYCQLEYMNVDLPSWPIIVKIKAQRIFPRVCFWGFTYVICENDTQLPDLVLDINRIEPGNKRRK